MKDKFGKHITSGTWLLCVNDTHCGEVVQVQRNCHSLIVPDCNGVDCGVPLTNFATENGCLVDYIVTDNPYEKSTFRKTVEKYKELDLTEICLYQRVIPANLDLIKVAKLRAMGYDDIYPYDEESVSVDMPSLIAAGCDYNDYDCCEATWENEDFVGMLNHFIKEANQYLVFASGCRWNGASGYKFCDNVADTISRSYDVTITPRAVSARGKTLVCCESSHDVPMGSTTIIVALTKDEYQLLRHADFEEVEAFANDMEASTRNHQ